MILLKKKKDSSYKLTELCAEFKVFYNLYLQPNVVQIPVLLAVEVAWFTSWIKSPRKFRGQRVKLCQGHSAVTSPVCNSPRIPSQLCLSSIVSSRGQGSLFYERSFLGSLTRSTHDSTCNYTICAQH